MKISKAIKIITAILVVIVICVNVHTSIVRKIEKKGYKYTYIWDKIEKIEKGEESFKDIEGLGLIETIEIIFYDKDLWNKLPLSENFKRKYSGPKKIIKKYNDYEHFSVGRSREKENAIYIDCVERDNIVSLITGKNITTFYTFEYVIDSNNQLDDLILLKEVDIDSMTAETYAVREYNK